MSVAIFDTYKAVNLLQQKGLSKAAAEGIAELLKDMTENKLVNRDDLQLSFNVQSATLIKWIASVVVAHSVGTAALTVSLLELLH